jgi:quinol monooxygenase YgiN
VERTGPPTDSTVGLVVSYTVPVELADHAAELLAKMAEAVRESEPGCLLWVAIRSQDAQNVFHLTELYADEDAFERHAETAHFSKYIVDGIRSFATQRMAARGALIGHR